ncbi:hypothetical protein DNTS_034165 [Danionella cerebrum]|uniref:Uncharacterized protein n=1 Tax=Danionella cerebrum TaxID=2873325 RepID=A0A553QK02_9TELE|nr:hypothetical protein DNTS_034165 [Danionella translucida]
MWHDEIEILVSLELVVNSLAYGERARVLYKDLYFEAVVKHNLFPAVRLPSGSLVSPFTGISEVSEPALYGGLVEQWGPDSLMLVVCGVQ